MKKSKTRKVTKTGNKSQCQCISSCKNKTLKGKHFCEIHTKSCPRISPLSGYEPDYDPLHWNNKYNIKETHNCFAYAFNINDDKQIKKCNDPNCDVPFHQPGMAAGYPKFKSSKPKTCPNMMARLIGDNPNLKMATFEEKCPVGTSKIALIVDENEDYHFLRQDSNGMWSHKGGSQPVKNVDAAGRLIYDPALADYNYKKDSNGYLNYDIFCSYLCVPRITPVKLKVGGRKIKSKSKKIKNTKKNI